MLTFPLKYSEKGIIFGADRNELLLTDKTVTVLIHLAEQLLGLADVAGLCPHHLVDGRHHPATVQSLSNVQTRLSLPLHLIEVKCPFA